MKLSKKCAFALIRAWQADAKLERLDSELQSEIKDKVGYFRYRITARAFVGAHAQDASDLCFAGKFQQAAISLMRVGITKARSGYEKELQRVRTSTRDAERRKGVITEGIDRLYAPYRRSEQWGVCK